MTTPEVPADAPALVPLGWDERWAALALGARGRRPGRVVRVDRGLVTVATEHGTERARPCAALREGDALGLPATGDWVMVDDRDDGPEVTAVLDRRSAFVRGDPMEGWATSAQVVAANVDHVFIVHALISGPNLRRLERELVLTYESGANPVVVLTKADLVDEASGAIAAVRAVAPVVDVVVTSSVTGEGLDRLREYERGHRTVALIGASGVGKSTLVNLFLGEERQATAEVRATDRRGRHTTTARELVVLPEGGVLVDTPGLRAVALWDADDGFARAFADVEELASGCRFRDCAHGTEPGCAVRAAVDDGRLDAARLDSYLRLDEELERLAIQADVRARAEKNRRDRVAQRAYRAAPKRKS
jgi:ribosome biogenesis GTPase